MKTLYVRNIRSVSENLSVLQKRLKVGITINQNQVSFNGKEENVYDAIKAGEIPDFKLPA